MGWGWGKGLEGWRKDEKGVGWGVFPGDACSKEPACQCRRRKRSGLILGSGRSPGGGHGNPLQYSCLVNPLDREAWQTIVHRVAKSQTQLNQLNTREQGRSGRVKTQASELWSPAKWLYLVGTGEPVMVHAEEQRHQNEWS